MWTETIPSEKIFHANRWTVSYFTETPTSDVFVYGRRPLAELVTERRTTVDPQQYGNSPIVYLGLENVRSVTGELIDFALRPGASIKSRSKTFQKNDVLFGRLRPELNKVYLAQQPVSEGLCSGEFIVLAPRQDVVIPRFLRQVLTSPLVMQLVSKFTVGASLPRMTVGDLLSIEVPVPPLAVQSKLVESLFEIDREIIELRERLAMLPSYQAEEFQKALVNA